MSDEITPGEWRVSQHHMGGSYDISAGPGADGLFSTVAVGIRNHADARLIAAAKRMLAAFTNVVLSECADDPLGRTIAVPARAMILACDAVRAATGTPADEPIPDITDGLRLAFAHIDGDVQAALLLADEVQMAAQAAGTKSEFVPRDRLLARIAELETEVREMSEQLHAANAPDEFDDRIQEGEPTGRCVSCRAELYHGDSLCGECRATLYEAIGGGGGTT